MTNSNTSFTEAGLALSAEELAVINQRLPEVHWKEALRDLEASGQAGNIQFFENRRMGNFHLLLGCPSRERVLDVAAGTGIVSVVLADYFETVVATEFDKTLVDFLRQRFTQDGQTNIHVIHTRDALPPFRAASFDLIVAHGILHRLNAQSPEAVSRDVHESFLRQCHEALKPGGRICLAIENRYHFNFLLGRGYPGAFPLSPLVPGRVADLLSRFLCDRPARQLYSERAARRLLAGAGFEDVESYIALPSFKNPIAIIPTSSPQIAHEMLTSWGNAPDGLLKRNIYAVLSKTGLLHHLLHSFFITGHKGA